MNRPIVVHPLAAAEASEAAAWYAGRSTRVALRFRERIAEALRKLEGQPLRYPVVHEERGYAVRAVRLGAFPYSILFTVTGDRIDVLAIAHGRRWPSYWRPRMR